MHYLVNLDSLGAIQRMHKIFTRPEDMITVPDGTLLTGRIRVTLSSRTRSSTVLTLLGHDGREKWRRFFGSEHTIGVGAAPQRDGSYVVATFGLVPGSGSPEFYAYDNKLYRVSATGDSLDQVVYGTAGYHDEPARVIGTTDGGVAVVGWRSLTFNQPREGVLTKLDSAFNVEWQYILPSNLGSAGSGSAFFDVRELPGGRFIVLGTSGTVPHLAVINPPAAGGSTGYATFQYRPAYYAYRMVYDEADSTAYLSGTRYAAGTTDVGLQRLGGLIPPAPSTFCDRPPVVPAPTYGPPQGTTVAFALDSATTRPGPRHGVVSLVTWDWGDGSAPDTGWVATHTFASTAPVRVRVCATNNLSCRSCTEVFPFGPVGRAESDDALSFAVFPNPSADGRYTIQLDTHTTPAGAALTVADALGREVWRGTVTSARTVLDLRTQPPGFYLLRLTTPDGRTSARRLVRGQ